MTEFPIAEPEDEDGHVTLKEQDRLRFQVARNGDHLLCPFQCDTCHFRNIQGRDAIANSVEDFRLLRCIRRANLDAMWAREPGTVEKNLREARRGAYLAQSVGMKTPFPPMGPYPLADTFGMGAAVVMLLRSLDAGSHAATIQFATMRKMRSAFSNVFHASAVGYGGSMVMAKDTRKLMVTECPTFGDWYERFVRGCHKRMGDIVKPDRALSLPILAKMMMLVEFDWERSRGRDRLQYALEAAFYLIAFCGALRGEEVPMTDLGGVVRHWDAGEAPGVPVHVVVALLGRFKNEIGERYHLVPLAGQTRSGLEPRKWIGRVVGEYGGLGISHGPMFRDGKGIPARAGMMEAAFYARLETIQDECPDLIGIEVSVPEEYGVYRSFRRGATSEAVNRGVPPNVIEANNRWRRVEQAGTRQASMPMIDHYADIRLMLNHLLRFSSEL